MRRTGWVLVGFVFVAGALLLLTGTAAKFNPENWNAERVFDWVTTIVFPVGSVVVLLATAWKHRVRLETADPPIWGKKQLEFHPKWYAVVRHSRAGLEIRSMYSWQTLQLKSSGDAWLFNQLAAQPLLIMRHWLSPDEEQLMDQFLVDLCTWQSVPGRAAQVASTPSVFEPLPADGIPFAFSKDQQAELQRVLPRAYQLFPHMNPSGTLVSPTKLKWLSLCILISGLSYPIYLFLIGMARFEIGIFVPLAIAQWFYSLSRQGKMVMTGTVTKSAIWNDGVIWRTRVPLSNYSKITQLDNVLLLSSPTTTTPYAICSSSFETEQHWLAARQRIDEAVGSVRS